MLDSAIKLDCHHCSLLRLCLPRGLNSIELHSFENIVQKTRPLKKAQYLYRAGDPMSSIFVVKHGAFKAHMNPPDGEEHISGFHFPGEVMGLDGLAEENYQCDVIALDDAQVCKVGIKDFESVSSKFPALQREIMSISSRSATAAQRMLLLIAKRPVEERLVMFLLSISQRFRHVGMPSDTFRLPMTHHDIANYLGMTPETISRQFKRLQKSELISVKGRLVTINDLDQLRHQISDDEDSQRCQGILAKHRATAKAKPPSH